MLSIHLPPNDLVSAKVNMFWDGLFHAFTWMMTLGGWGLFNVVEGSIDHQLLGVHHVRPGAHQVAWDVGFLAFGALLVLTGWRLARAGRTDRRARGGVRGEPLRAH